MSRSKVLNLILLAALAAGTVTHDARPAARLAVSASAPVGAVAHSGGEDQGPEGDEDDGPIDCTIPDNQDDSGCDTGDVDDSEGAAREATDGGGADRIVPRGGVQTGAGGSAVRQP